MAKKKLPGHKWFLSETLDRWFMYKCKACGCVTLNGHPLLPPFDLECG